MLVTERGTNKRIAQRGQYRQIQWYNAPLTHTQLQLTVYKLRAATEV